MRNEKAGRRSLSRSQTEASRRGQIGFVDGANDDRQALRPETFLDRVQSFARPRRLDDNETRWIEPKTKKARRRRRAELPGKRPGPAPQNPWSPLHTPLRPRQCVDPADGEARGKADPGHPVGRRGAIVGGRRTFNLMESVRFEACG